MYRQYSLLIPELMENPLWPQLPRPTCHISPYHHQESDHYYHTYREERIQYVMQYVHTQSSYTTYSSCAVVDTHVLMHERNGLKCDGNKKENTEQNRLLMTRNCCSITRLLYVVLTFWFHPSSSLHSFWL